MYRKKEQNWFKTEILLRCKDLYYYFFINVIVHD